MLDISILLTTPWAIITEWICSSCFWRISCRFRYYLIGNVSTGFTWKIAGKAILWEQHPFEVAVVWVCKSRLNSWNLFSIFAKEKYAKNLGEYKYFDPTTMNHEKWKHFINSYRFSFDEQENVRCTQIHFLHFLFPRAENLRPLDLPQSSSVVVRGKDEGLVFLQSKLKTANTLIHWQHYTLYLWRESGVCMYAVHTYKYSLPIHIIDINHNLCKQSSLMRARYYMPCVVFFIAVGLAVKLGVVCG